LRILWCWISHLTLSKHQHDLENIQAIKVSMFEVDSYVCVNQVSLVFYYSVLLQVLIEIYMLLYFPINVMFYMLMLVFVNIVFPSFLNIKFCSLNHIN
jgi:hypothetical protein